MHKTIGFVGLLVSLIVLAGCAGRPSLIPNSDKNLRRTPSCSVLVLSDDFGDAWVQVDGTAEVFDMPSQEAEDGLVEYFRCISGEHPDWAEYRQAMRAQEKSLIRITPTRWGPIATGGFPPEVAARLDS